MNNNKFKKINTIVNDLLAKASIATPPVDIELIARMLDINLFKKPYDEKKGKLSGVLIRDINTNTIGVNSNDHEHRQRFTIAHEIGHFLLHEGVPVFVDKEYKVNFRKNSTQQGTDIVEIDANNFAGMLLIPEKFLLMDLSRNNVDILSAEDMEKLAEKYNVSPQAMALRLGNL
jgi:Zn-dependent peptidase ImmA (M78 family)